MGEICIRWVELNLERGVVWEETIILLPDNVHYAFLSATVPNARQFAEWVAYLHHQPCHVVYTDFRSLQSLLPFPFSLFCGFSHFYIHLCPSCYCLASDRIFPRDADHIHKMECPFSFSPVPLQHYIYPSGGEGIHLIVDEAGNFLQQNFDKAMSVLAEESSAESGAGRGRGGRKWGKVCMCLFGGGWLSFS